MAEALDLSVVPRRARPVLRRAQLVLGRARPCLGAPASRRIPRRATHAPSSLLIR